MVEHLEKRTLEGAYSWCGGEGHRIRHWESSKFEQRRMEHSTETKRRVYN